MSLSLVFARVALNDNRLFHISNVFFPSILFFQRPIDKELFHFHCSPSSLISAFRIASSSTVIPSYAHLGLSFVHITAWKISNEGRRMYETDLNRNQCNIWHWLFGNILQCLHKSVIVSIRKTMDNGHSCSHYRLSALHQKWELTSGCFQRFMSSVNLNVYHKQILKVDCRILHILQQDWNFLKLELNNNQNSPIDLQDNAVWAICSSLRSF